MSSFLFCTQCEENHDNSFGGHCPVCGNRLISGSRSETSSASIPSRQHTFTARMDIPGLEDVEFLEGMLDVLGIQFGDALIQRLRGIQPETPISNEYIKSIGRITLDRNLSILPDITLNIGQYKAMLVPASFGSQVIVGNSISSKIVWATPEFGDSAISNNVDVCGSIVLFKRGKVPFIDKALKAVASGAIAVLICQSFDTWPFAITDSTVVDSSEIPIPIFMISKQDAALVDAMLHNKKGGDVIASINRRDTETLCSICHDSMCAICKTCKNNLLGIDLLLLTPRRA